MNKQAVDRRVLSTVLRYGPAGRSSLPALSSVKVDTDRGGSWTRVTTNNLEWQAELTLPAWSGESGSFGTALIPRRDAVEFPLARLVENRDGVAVLAPVDGSGSAVNVKALEADQFPSFPRPSLVAASIGGDWGTFIEALHFVAPAVSEDLTRASLCGVRFEVSGLRDGLESFAPRTLDACLVSTDGHRLHVAPLPVLSVESYGIKGPYPCLDGDSVILPGPLVEFLLRFPVLEASFFLHVGYESCGLVVIRDDGGEFPVITFRPVEGPFPDYRCVVRDARSFPHVLAVGDEGVKSLRDAFRSASRAQDAALKRGGALLPVRVQSTDRGVSVTFRDTDGVGVSLGVDLPSVPPFGVYGFNARYLVEALTGWIVGTSTVFRFEAPDSAVKVEFGSADRFALVMPVRLTD